MKKPEKYVLELAREADLSIRIGRRSISVHHRFNIFDSGRLSILFFLCVGIFIVRISYTGSAEFGPNPAGIIAGVVLILVTGFVLIYSAFDFIRVAAGDIRYRYHFRHAHLLISRCSFLWLEHKTVYVERRHGADYTSIVVTHYIEYEGKKKAVLRYALNDEKPDRAVRLGHAINRILNAKISEARKELT